MFTADVIGGGQTALLVFEKPKECSNCSLSNVPWYGQAWCHNFNKITFGKMGTP